MCFNWKQKAFKEAKKELAKEIANELINSTNNLGNNKKADYVTGHQSLKGEVDKVLEQYLK